MKSDSSEERTSSGSKLMKYQTQTATNEQERHEPVVSMAQDMSVLMASSGIATTASAIVKVQIACELLMGDSIRSDG